MNEIPEFDHSDAQELTTVLDWTRWGASQFTEAGLHFGHGTDNAWDEALVLLTWSIHQSWENFDKIQHARLTESERRRVYELYARRINERIPAAYLTGVAWFAGYPYKVNEDVLVPRSPIAELILKQFQPWLQESPVTVLDLCTGSACIGIACAHEFADAQVVVSDLSEEALVVARKNIEFHQLGERVRAIKSDGFDQLTGQKFDLIVSNPPYVDAGDIASMPKEFHAEPPIGLASGVDGLDITRRILSEASNMLTENGWLVVEVGNSWPALEAAFPNVPFVWPEFEFGGHGVFVLSRQQLVESLC